MAKDVSSRSVSSSNSGSASPSNSDQQKVPPLRIVLNTAGNQKSSSTAVALASNQQQDIKRDKTQDVKTDNNNSVLKTGGRVRIKLGTNKQTSKNNTTTESSTKSPLEDGQKFKSSIIEKQDNIYKEDSATNYSHLRRITRRSQRTVQTVSNEDEESISSMTSTDENQNTTNSNNSDNNSAQDPATTSTHPSATSITTTTTTSTTTTTATTTSTNSNVEAPRRYKRRKGEAVECSLSEHDGPFGFQNYKLPVQNSFELFKNIRKQVDKKLKNLNSVHSKGPHGVRDYMLTRGAYLLDGNKLGNGTNLFMSEDGGLNPPPMGKYHALRHNRVNYSVPNRAKVPLSLPVNSPLYNLFIEQEKERYKMRMHHIKEREKLTLAAEQEIVRVYNQAAMAAANQPEPFSACTLLKHQEVYNYLDSDGFTILASADAQQDKQQEKQGANRTRRRHHEQISPPPARKNSNAEESSSPPDAAQKDDVKTSPGPTNVGDDSQKDNKPSSNDTPIDQKKNDDVEASSKDESPPTMKEEEKDGIENENEEESTAKSDNSDNVDRSSDNKIQATDIKEESTSQSEKGETNDTTMEVKEGQVAETEVDGGGGNEDEAKEEAVSDDKVANESPSAAQLIKLEPMDVAEIPEAKETTNVDHVKIDDLGDEPQASEDTDKLIEPEKEADKQDDSLNVSASTEIVGGDNQKTDDQIVAMEQDTEIGQAQEADQLISDDEMRAYNKEIFLSQLQAVDDKWDKIRNEMLIRHRNEAESLYAVQRLEWEWKTKETGACDVRTTPIIDTTLVPKLNIYSQDY